MIYKFRVLTFSLLALLANSCGDEENKPIENDTMPSCKILAYSTSNFEYDVQGRLSRFQWTVEPHDYHFTYLVNEIVVEEGGEIIKKIKVDGEGKVLEYYTKGTNNGTMELSKSYEYNQAGRLVRVNLPNGQFHELAYDDDGNVTSVIYRRADGTTVVGMKDVLYDTHENPLGKRALRPVAVRGYGEKIDYYLSLSSNNVVSYKEWYIDSYVEVTYTYGYNEKGLPESVERTFDGSSKNWLNSYVCD
jgi:YD repeat-containing protein